MNFICGAIASMGIEFCESPISLETQQGFIAHMSRFGLSYGTQEEYNFRLQQFAAKDTEINEINARETSFTVGHNQFSTWTDFEYKRLLGFKMPTETFEETVLDIEGIPASIDWRSKGAVNAVKNQGQCGSCWAFSATCAVEGRHQIKTGQLLSLSEQQLVDCDSTSYGCNGGWQSNAFKYLEKHGQELETAYPYTARDGSCKAASAQGRVDVEAFTTVPKQSVSQLKAAIAQGPTSVTIEADRTVFQMYTSGVLDSTSCGTNLDHAVTAVGYGTEGGKDYYLVRNSWGASWGEQGYIKIAAVKGVGICGIQQISVYPKTD